MSSHVVRAKFRCMSITSHHQGDTEVRLLPVYNKPGGGYEVPPENKEFWEATPAGEIVMTIRNEAAAKHFEPGQAYYIDFTPAPG